MQSLADLLAAGVRGKVVIVRSDLNVPLDGARVADDGRIRASLPTITSLADAGARVVVCSHLGRPKGAFEASYSLAPVAERLSSLLGWPVPLADFDPDAGVVGPPATALVAGLDDSDVVLLENLRFDAGETSKDAGLRGAFGDRLASLGSLGTSPGAYVDDAFGAVHRAHASVVELPARLPHYAGGLVLREVEVLERLTAAPATPYVVVLGGSKVSDKLAVIDALLPKVDRLLIGGGMCFTFLAAQGHDVGGSLLEEPMIDTCARLLRERGRPDPAAERRGRGGRGVRRRAGLGRRRRRDPGWDEGPRHRPGQRGGVRGSAEGRGDGFLERADGRLRAGAFRRRHACRRAGGG